ncbi:MAG: enoyl-CoA hydratase/isomerase family protein [Myxococcales bacterium]|nr:enoyl-CoA hydratase/isomerase family protein [Myxococcales bacterium]
MPSEHIQTELRDDGVFEIRFDRPAAKNSFTTDMYEAAADALDAASADAGARAVLLRGSGGDFSSGNDLRDFVERPPRGPEDTPFPFMKTLARFEKPVVARVDGVAVGIGATLLLHCDLVYAASDARFMLPFVNLGVSPECGSSFLLPRIAGHRIAAEAVMLGGLFDATLAADLGLVTRVVAPDALDESVARALSTLLRKPDRALRASKRLMRAHLLDDLLAHMDEEARVFCALLRTEESRAAIEGFFSKRR